MQLPGVELRPDLVMMLVLPFLVVARAAVPLDDEQPPPPPPAQETPVAIAPHEDIEHLRLEGGFGVRFGSQFIDGRDVGTVTPFHIDAGVRTSSWLIYGEYDLMSFAWPTTPVALSGGTPSGRVHGAHAAARGHRALRDWPRRRARHGQ